MPQKIRALLKETTERALLRAAPLWRSRRARHHETLVLAYHNILPHGYPPVGERSLHLPQAVFASHLDTLLDTHDVVPLDRIFDTPASARPRAAITFDDAYRGALLAGVAELVKRNLPATVFVAPGFVPDGSFWWDLVANGFDGRIDETTREYAMNDYRGETTLVVDWVAASGTPLPRLPAYARAGTLAEIRDAAAHPGIDIGSHTWSHCNLATSPESVARNQLERSLEWLRSELGDRPFWLSYPYGISTPAVERHAEQIGYAGAVKIAGGWHAPRRGTRFNVPRLNIPAGISTQGFALRAAGMITT